jgi:hypothetical protein
LWVVSSAGFSEWGESGYQRKDYILRRERDDDFLESRNLMIGSLGYPATKCLKKNAKTAIVGGKW